MHAYDAKDLQRLFGLPPSAVRALARAGTIHPEKKSGRLHYSFPDLVVLRTASALRAAKVSPRRINRTLQQLRALLPPGASLNGVSLTALGNRIAIREGAALREAESGQYALALDIVEEKGALRVIRRPDANSSDRGSGEGRKTDHANASRGDASSTSDATAVSADEQYARGLELEDTDVNAARIAYETCLLSDPEHREARINLGRLLHLAGAFAEAEEVYRAAFRPDPIIAFNLGVLLEDLEREPDAIVAYRSALALDPGFADAHYNLARLYERAQDFKSSLRHLLAYRRMLDSIA